MNHALETRDFNNHRLSIPIAVCLTPMCINSSYSWLQNDRPRHDEHMQSAKG